MPIPQQAWMEWPGQAELAAEMKEPFQLSRKLWEWLWIARTLEALGCLKPGAKGLGFACGREPLVDWIASRGCRVLATDAPGDGGQEWGATGQHSEGLADLDRGITGEDFRSRVSFQAVDMRAIPADLVGFDFLWSSCAFEHLGTIQAGLDFVSHAMACLKPGGVAIHTTEFSPEPGPSLQKGPVVIYHLHLEALRKRLKEQGHSPCLVLEWPGPSGPADMVAALPPYDAPHLRLAFGGVIMTSFGFYVIRGPR
jgi:SAM-dependent methyltransferase